MACSISTRITLDTIPLAEIRPGDDRFRITRSTGQGVLEASIARLGLLTPVLVRSGEPGAILVSGHRRAAACTALGWTRIPARVLPPDAPEYECACRAVGENSLARPLSPLETARALVLLDRCHPDGFAPPEDVAALGLPAAPAVRERLKGLVRLPAEVQSGIEEEAIAFPTACELGALDPAQATAVAGLLRRLGAGLNKQREILQLVLEISRRDGTPLRKVVSDPLLLSAMESAGGDSNRVTQSVRRFLRRRRFPAIDAAERKFEGLRRTLALGDGLRLDPPRDFEGTHFQLGCSFATLEELGRLRDRLDGLLRDPALKAIVDGKGRGFGEAC
jgi:ParB family transcriptional regulator, chromosome partitioning protein